MGTPADTRVAIVMAGIAVVLLTGLALGALARRFRQPAVIGEIAAGIVLGPSVLGQLPGHLTDTVFPTDVRPLLSAISQIGLILFMFLVGWQFEKHLIRGHGGAAAALSVSSVGCAFGLAIALAVPLYPAHNEVNGRHISFLAFSMFMGAAMSITAFPVLARILTEHRLTQTRIGTLALAGAAVNDVLAWCMLAYVSALVAAAGNLGNLAQISMRSAVYVAAMLLVVRPGLAKLVDAWGSAGRWRALLVLLCAGAFLSAYLTTWIGIHAIFGAFLFGFVMPREPVAEVGEHLRKPLDNIGVILLPVFFIFTGLSVDITGLRGRQWMELGAIIVVACVGKVIGAVVPARAFGFSWTEAKALGLLMNTRGLTELIILNAAISLGVLDGQMFTMMVLMALVTTALAGPLLPRREIFEQPLVTVAAPVTHVRRYADIGQAAP
jgi:Kef-type K+ transport system membrane component KefB